jgi:hypothetical protein
MLAHTTGADWQSFESRMRRRRAERLALRADVAADAGYPDDAWVCLEEARTLAPGLPELALIEAKLSTPPRQPVSSARKWTMLAMACVAALVGGVAMARTASSPAAIGPAPTPHVARPAEMAAPASAVATSPPAPHVKPEPQPQRQLPPAPSVEPLRHVRKVEPTVLTETRARPANTAAVEAPTSSALPLPPVPAPIPMPIAAPALAELPPAAPPVETPAAEPPQEPVVRSVLSRYASAYSSLDANAAQRVWPGVNRAALSRAFDSLASQHISLGDCRIDVAASSARARCAGSATWAPKVGGGGARTEARDWTFELTRAASGWQIVSARVQNR